MTRRVLTFLIIVFGVAGVGLVLAWMAIRAEGWTALSTADRIGFLALAVGILTAVGAFVGIYLAVKTLLSGDEAVRSAGQTLAANLALLTLTSEEIKATAQTTKAQFWVLIRSVFAWYDDVHAKFRPEGEWHWTKTQKGPSTAEEWARTEVYMGMFEYCEDLIKAGLLDQHQFSESYRYRIGNIVANPVVVSEKLCAHKKDWRRFIELCVRLKIELPAICTAP
jgi:hypothetical protein